MQLIFQQFANGKLLLSGEYFVLDAAVALAVPTRMGQHLIVQNTDNQSHILKFKSYDHLQNLWFEASYATDSDFDIQSSNETTVATTLQQILRAIRQLQPNFLCDSATYHATMSLEFPRDWGLGSSSTLLYCLARWADVNPYLLLEKTIGGSGYDLACAGIDNAITYRRQGINPNIQFVDFQPLFSKNLYFIHLTQKQNSREGIAYFRANPKDKAPFVTEINTLTARMLDAKTLQDFEQIILEHEQLISQFLDLPRAKNLYFSDYWGEVKSLGAWGGDFVLITSNRSTDDTVQYFKQKGFSTLLTYEQMVKPNTLSTHEFA